jgi:hypothetical protein
MECVGNKFVIHTDRFTDQKSFEVQSEDKCPGATWTHVGVTLDYDKSDVSTDISIYVDGTD